MTKYEKVSTGLSILAVVLAIALPIVSYYWLDPDLRNFKRRARLQVIGDALYELETVHLPDEGATSRWSQNGDYQVRIANVGQSPGKEIRIVTQDDTCPGDEKTETTHSFDFDPPVPYEQINKNNQTFITIARPLSPQETIRLTFRPSPLRVAVSNEFGETTLLETGVFRKRGCACK